MPSLLNPYISKVRIKNFRNFLFTEVELNHKQVIIGENKVGKTNFLRAIQLILDPSFSDNDRTLSESDFHETLVGPMETGEEIEIVLEIRGYAHNNKLVAQFSDAVISDQPPTLRFTYLFAPVRNLDGNILRYDFNIYQGTDPDSAFKSEHRSYINIYVIKALRDVERELKANRQSPLYKLVKKYEIAKDDLEAISTALDEAAEGILELDEIVHIKKTLQERFTTMSGLQKDNEVTLRTFDIDTERLLYNLQVYMGLKERPVSELSLGLANILYVSLMLILIKDRTIQPIIKQERFTALSAEDNDEILSDLYVRSERGNFILRDQIDEHILRKLYEFMDQHNFTQQAFTILAVEEPEAHLHPVLQRLLYREILHKSDTSTIFTSHSTFIASVAPLDTIVHIRRINDSSKIYSTANLRIPTRERRDIERYIDAKRGEIYFGKGIILVEGITEEYIIPAAANIFDTPLDDYGIVVCNIDSTNFKPYVQVLNMLAIPWILFTDGDYYELRSVKNKKGEDKEERVYHIMSTGAGPHYRGNEIVANLLVGLNVIKEEDIPEDFGAQDDLFNEHGAFIGKYTLEVDMMEDADEVDIHNIKVIYGELIKGGDAMQENFDEAINDGDFWLALKKIETNISKGRFAQRLSQSLTEEMIPNYVKDGITAIVDKIKVEHE